MTWIVCLGECMIELSDAPGAARGEVPRMRRAFGGDTLNTAVYAARCAGRSARVDYVTALGDDPFSAEMIAAWSAEGVGTDLVLRLPGRRPGLYMIRTDAAGDRSFFYWRSDAAARETIRAWGADALAERLAGCDVFYYSGISLGILDDESRAGLLSVAGRLRAGGAMVAFDGNYRPALWDSADAARSWAARACASASVVLPSFDDERTLFGDPDPEATADRLAALGVAEAAIKRGGAPCLVVADGARDWIAPEPGPPPVDTTAAGDSFNAAYLVARVRGAAPGDAARAGHALAAKVVAAPGAIIPEGGPSP